MAYKTEQKEAVIAFLSKNAQRQFTAHALTEELTGSADIGESTVYRLIKQLVDEGRVRRFTMGNSRQVYYQYVGGETCGSHLHLKCTECGSLFHMNASVSEFVIRQVLATDRFALDENQTMLFGTCAGCRERNMTTHA